MNNRRDRLIPPNDQYDLNQLPKQPESEVPIYLVVPDLDMTG
ncbi:hypothetical protein ABIF65_001049 [Bradyrhizobium japonicum]|jgi:hypothetical protein|nr:hypothetical protein [Bradyrhizobium japonicum]MCP1777764.1 hypothetical protein [Bradyrhizobium japonicum]MCP1857256.1 hypothetical protein [Bradyrhizobium japonicum]MCP1888071.1 hypothetical protein [Bradyrhizobium japonicum]MCP1959237.1 hypothetical protein [Bradyrhizobium japonicum]